MESTQSEAFKARTAAVGPYLRTVRFIFDYLLYDCLGGPRHLKVSHVVTTVCLTLIPVTIFMKIYFDVDTLVSWWTTAIYLSYLFVWPMKGLLFPDEAWEAKLTYPSAVIFALYNLAELSGVLYYTTGYHPNPYPLKDEIWLAFCTVFFILGVLMFTISDAQKHFILKYRKPRALFTDGFYKYIRHPNYVGQTMCYTTFMLMSWDWIPLLIYIPIFVFIFYTNMKVKEASMSRYPEWESYKKSSSFAIPKIW